MGLQLIENILDLYFHPNETLLKIKQGSNLKESFLIFTTSFFSLFLSVFLSFPVSFTISKFSILFLIGTVILFFVLSLKVMWVHFWAQILKKELEEKITDSLILSSYSFIPFYLFFPFTLILQGTNGFLLILICIVFIFWTFLLSVKTIQTVYSVSFFKATLLEFSPLFIFPCFFLFTAFFIFLVKNL
ncbi:MAG: hypothetical protein A3I11_03345 [Elusimicrobia bacterium RIFCSPLOWO2_02_FULL_39_32]|nr:MAG: hypothetical protein A2034_05590 [Elusimicrobia bacterium GWA2_38_7]OGR79416.1 MAG: hypothetical protein A3B80_01915 [Elusimicrobia bacterium RIFCSPHIGHO2_02_FULL_39_36]OGR92743.1 MAG: hypothetical protein A3I11_03345 [Elusimicrobia bacterium RIFCSPLOWO2_02_FULL_39_32]OGR99528.1 MAG: hypothetical protein A3G85_00700 [Elusimicrobia bacterium RIFCSPLOWO2_12_FULL_39_28]